MVVIEINGVRGAGETLKAAQDAIKDQVRAQRAQERADTKERNKIAKLREIAYERALLIAGKLAQMQDFSSMFLMDAKESRFCIEQPSGSAAYKLTTETGDAVWPRNWGIPEAFLFSGAGWLWAIKADGDWFTVAEEQGTVRTLYLSKKSALGERLEREFGKCTA